MKLQAVHTPLTAQDVYDAFAQIWPEAGRPTLLLLTAHSVLESGWYKECYNYNLGNAKAKEGDDYCERDCGEELPISKVPLEDPQIEVVKRYERKGVPYASVLVHAGHPWSRFRAFPSLSAAAMDHLKMLRSTYPAALPGLFDGDATKYSHALSASHYYTADVDQYTHSLVGVLNEVSKKIPAPKPIALVGLEAVFTPRPGETRGEFAARCVRSLNGSKPSAGGTLYHLAAKVETRPEAEMYRATNCATSMRWIWAWLGCPHKYCYLPDEVMRAKDPAGPVSWDITIAREMGALVDARGSDARKIAGPGWGVHYSTPGYNDDHMEWVLSIGETPEQDEHGGGGRAGNKITVERGDIRRSAGRPVAHLIDPEKMMFAHIDATHVSVDPTPAPEPEPTPAPEPEPTPPLEVPAPPINTPHDDARVASIGIIGAALAFLSSHWALGVEVAVAILLVSLVCVAAYIIARRNH